MTQDISLPIATFAADIESADNQKRRVDVIWSTAQRIRFYSYELGEYDLTLGLEPENVRLDFLQRGGPVLNSHSQGDVDDVLGKVESASVNGIEGRATLRFSNRAEVDAVWGDVQSGVLKNVSVGTRLHKLEDISEEGDSIPHYFAADHEPLEISIVPIPADKGAHIQNAGRRSPCTIERAQSMAAPNIETKKVTDDDVKAARLAKQIRKVVITQAHLPEEFADELIEQGVTLQQAREAALDRIAEEADKVETRSGIMVIADQTTPHDVIEQMSDALASRHGGPEIEGPALQYAAHSIPRIAEEVLRHNGRSIPMGGPSAIVTQAMHTTSDFPAILANVATKRLRDAYMAATGGVQSLARESSQRDFKGRTSVQFGEAPTLDLVGEHSEFKRGTMAEASESYKLDTYGKVFSITRQALVNDDLEAFSGVIARFGVSARERERANCAALVTSNPDMSDGVAVFHADHGNLAASGGALSVTTLGTARKAMRLQTGVDGTQLIEVAPTHLLVPAALETDAEKVLATIAATKTTDVNPFGGALTLVVDPRLDAASSTAWYLVGQAADGMEYAYLEGERGVQVFTREGFDVDGVEIKARLDFGAGWLDWRGWYKNAGA